jgi:hypothetical protein
LRIIHAEYLPAHVHVDHCRLGVVLVAVADYHWVVFEFVEGFQRNPLLLQQSLDLLSLRLLLQLLLVLFIVLILVSLFLIA